MRRFRSPLSALVMMVLVVSASGCVGWKTVSVPPQELLQSGHNVHAVRVTRQNKMQVELFDPVLVGDSIRGTPTERAIQRITVPLTDVRQIQSRHTSMGKTMLMILAVGGGVAIYGLLQELNGTGVGQ
jgi:hypothetical protein